MTVEEQKKLEEEKAAAELKKAEDAKKDEKTVTEEQLLKAIQNLEDFAKAKKNTEEEEEEEKEEEEEEESKSYAGNFEEDETLEKAIEVSPFLEAIVGETVTSLTAMGKDLNKFSKSMGEFDGKHIEALKAISDVVKSLSTKIEEFAKSTDERLKKIEEQPIGARKSILKAAVIEKAFSGKTGDEDVFATMPKRKIVDLIAKAVEDGKINPNILFSFEAEQNYPLTDEHKDILKAYVK